MPGTTNAQALCPGCSAYLIGATPSRKALHPGTYPVARQPPPHPSPFTPRQTEEQIEEAGGSSSPPSQIPTSNPTDLRDLTVDLLPHPSLKDYYDHQHRAYLMAEKHMRLRPLKIRSHGVSSNDMPYDERYTEYIKRLGLLPFITLVSRSTPNLNAAAITALVDRWRPETHTFHLRTGEITPTLQDVSMIFGLPIAGEPLCMSTNSDGWRNAMHLLIGMAPEELEDKSKDRVPAGATYAWIMENFRECPNPAEVELDDACRRAGESAGIGVGRPKEVGHHPWPSYNRNPLRQPTWAYKWDVVSEMTSDVDAMYLKYTNEFDAITPEKVEWEPYGCGDEFGIAPGFDINPKCLDEQSL
uniref:Uncharacterized protein n=1 Tax=Avena sativa TaxID=4498 RepID=A0ACD6A919_AVESA